MLAPGTVIQDRYRVIAQIAKGGMGAVYQARDLRLRTDVAIKETLFSDDAYRQAFEREAQVLARLRHQALPRVIDHFIERNGQFLVMEYIGGEDLGNQLTRLGRRFASPQALPIVLKWAEQLLDVLHYLHSRPSPVIHRDIKPKNLKLSASHDIILLDFGLSRGGMTVAIDVTDDGTTTPESRKVYGFTPPYAPFEQMRDGDPDQRSDIYSLGATLYHMLTGTLPPDAMARMARLLNSQPDSLRPIQDLAPHVPVAVAEVIEHSLAVLIDDRFRSAREMRDALLQARGQRRPRIQPITNRHPEYQSAAPAVEIPLPTPSVVAPPTPSVAADSTPMGTLMRRMITGSPIRAVAYGPDGKSLAAGYDDHTIGLWHLEDDTPTATLRGHSSSVRGVSFSSQSGLLATASDDETVRLWEVKNGIQRRMVRLPGCQIESICFSPDGKYLAAGGWGSAVVLMTVDDDRIEPLGSLPCPFVHSLAFSPDGALLAAGGFDGAIYLWRIDDLEREGVINGFSHFIYSVAFSPDGRYLAASSNNRVRVWRMPDQLAIETLEGHSGPVRSVAFSPDGQTLASGSEDRSVRFWRLSDGALMPLSLDHSAGVASIVYSPDGHTLAAGTHDGRIFLWRAKD
ncbi:MAG: protein kinase [Oscillochloris sp.]|nr:protein kinase [Oscillochloris sp.]